MGPRRDSNIGPGHDSSAGFSDCGSGNIVGATVPVAIPKIIVAGTTTPTI